MIPTSVELLTLLRRRRRRSQRECATRLGVTLRCLRGWEDQSRKPKPIVERAILDFVADNKAADERATFNKERTTTS